MSVDVFAPIRAAFASLEVQAAMVRLSEAEGRMLEQSARLYPRMVVMGDEKRYEKPKATLVANVNDLVAGVTPPSEDERPRVPDLVGTRWRRAWHRVTDLSAIAAGHMLPDTFGGVTRDLDGNEVFVHRISRIRSPVLEVVSQEVVPNPFDPVYPRLRALVVDPRGSWRRVFVFSLVQNEGGVVAACPALDVGHDRRDPYCGEWIEGRFTPLCAACGDAVALGASGVCRPTAWRAALDEHVGGKPSARELERAPRPRMPVMDVVGGAGAAALVCGGL